MKAKKLISLILATVMVLNLAGCQQAGMVRLRPILSPAPRSKSLFKTAMIIMVMEIHIRMCLLHQKALN